MILGVKAVLVGFEAYLKRVTFGDCGGMSREESWYDFSVVRNMQRVMPSMRYPTDAPSIG